MARGSKSASATPAGSGHCSSPPSTSAISDPIGLSMWVPQWSRCSRPTRLPDVEAVARATSGDHFTT
eukprot:6069362-Lingulodinium_polyedra.AAC.1